MEDSKIFKFLITFSALYRR